METTTGSQPSEPSREVPPDLLQRLHEANARFHEEKQCVEEAMKSTEFDHEKHVEQARDRLREAENALEEVTRKIGEAMKKSNT